MLAMLLFAFVWIVLYAGLFAVAGPWLERWARARVLGRSGLITNTLVAVGATVGAYVLFATFGTVTTGPTASGGGGPSKFGTAAVLAVEYIVVFVIGVAASVVGSLLRQGRAS